MTDGEALLAAILAHPDADTPRLMYADWLDENGQGERAEFIRVQIAIANEMKCEPAGKDSLYLVGWRVAHHHERAFLAEFTGGKCQCTICLQERETELWQTAHLDVPPACLGRLHETPNGGEFAGACHLFTERGFYGKARCSAAVWLEHGDAIRREHPVTRVKLTTVPEYGEAVASWSSGSPNMRTIRTTLAGQPVSTGPIPEGDSARLYLLEARWPGVEFELPSVLDALLNV